MTDSAEIKAIKFEMLGLEQTYGKRFLEKSLSNPRHRYDELKRKLRDLQE